MATGELRTNVLNPAVDPSAVSPAVTPPVTFRPHRLSVGRYEQMVAKGIFGEKEPIFLWHGGLVEKMTKGPSHTYSVNRLYKRLDRLVPAGCFVEQDGPMVLGDDSMPEPDLKVVRGFEEDYKGRAPSAGEVALVIEVADSSLAVDSGEVQETYARKAIPVYWVANIPQRRIEVYTEPQGTKYAQEHFYESGELVPVVLDGLEIGRIAVDEVLG
jgi:Uma2 family endonuclease